MYTPKVPTSPQIGPAPHNNTVQSLFSTQHVCTGVTTLFSSDINVFPNQLGTGMLITVEDFIKL